MQIIIVGLGIKFYSHLTQETVKVIQQSNVVYYLANNDPFNQWIESNAKNAIDLSPQYFSESNRADTYSHIAELLIDDVKKQKHLCFAIYGHPTFLVQISTLIKEKSKHSSIEVTVLPAVSSLDCMMADLFINPGNGGMSIHEATELLLYSKPIDTTSHLILLQIGAIAKQGHQFDYPKRGLSLLKQYLIQFYSGDTPISLYEASTLPGKGAVTSSIPLSTLSTASTTTLTSLYIAPQTRKSADNTMKEALKALN